MTQKFLLTALLFGSLMWNTAKATETEPNNTKATANVLTLNGSNTGAITAADEDWWSVTTTGDGQLDATIVISNALLMWCQIYDNDGTTLLAQGYTSGTATVSKDGLAAGTYYLRVYAYYSGQLPAYTISNALTVPAQINDAEPNGSRALAKTLPLNNSRTGHINYYYNNIKDSFDWYKVTTNADGRLRLTMTSANGKNVWAYLYDNDGTTQLAAGYTAGSAVVVNKDGLAAGTYYIKVNTYYSTEWAPYTLADSLFVPTEPNDTEPDSTKALALTLPLNGSATGHVNYYYNNHKDSADWYKVTTNADGRLRLTMTSGNGKNVWAYLYDNDGTTQLAAGYTAGSTVVVNKDGLAAGTYYIKVKTYYTNEWVPYTLADSLFVPTQANDSEPNDVKAQALNFPVNGSKTGHINYYYNLVKDEEDWYKLTTTSDGNINIAIASNNGQNVWAYLYDNDGTTLVGSAYSSGSTNYNVDGLAAGTYYIKIKTYYTSEWAPYTLTNTFTPYSNANDVEPNTAPYQAKTLPANSTSTGHVNFYYNLVKDGVDWHKINYTGSGALTLNMVQEAHKSNGALNNFWVYVYKDTATSPIASQYSSAASWSMNLTGLTQGYYWIKVNTYYSYEFASYSINPTFTQATKAKISVTVADTALTCTSTNSITFKCTKSQAPYTVQLYRYGLPYGSVLTINNTKNFTIQNLPQGNYYATAFGDGATGTAFGKSATISLLPPPTDPSTSNLTQTTARANWTTVSCAKFYAVQFHKSGDSAWTTKNTTGNVGVLVLKALLPNTTYTWRVQAADSLGTSVAVSAFTDSLSFTTSALFAGAGSSSEESIAASATIPGKVSVFPNPATTQVKIQLGNVFNNQTVNAVIKDMNGNIVWSSMNVNASALNNKSVDVSKLTGGIYVLQVSATNSKTMATHKIVVSR
ncbi:MAG TPA: pre-peptidase C-terminal domain-containing protein [Panacibacter sp.]|nr:pre-peptidase C-terminal domain-containing protein [Panacibacter sp.]